MRLKGIFLGSPHLGGILLIFTVILCPALGPNDLINLLLASVAFCHPNSLQLVLPEGGIPAWGRAHAAPAQGMGDSRGSFKRREKK